MNHLKKGLVLWALGCGAMYAAGSSTHSDPIASVLLAITVLFFCAIAGRYFAYRLNQPAVLGELLVGVVVGNALYLVGFQLIVILRESASIFNITEQLLAGKSINEAIAVVIPNSFYANQMVQALNHSESAEYFKIAYAVDIFSRYGVLFLLFMAGLESSLDELKQTGRESVLVALIGVSAPMILGFAIAWFLMPQASLQADLFLAATLSATSVGITARVLAEMKKMGTREARTILGAAMLDDILGLIILAVVSGVVVSGTVDWMDISSIIFNSVLFFSATICLGPLILRHAAGFFRFLALWEAKLFISFLFLMSLAWVAASIHLASIIGAFTAGVLLHEGYFKTDESFSNEHLSIRQLVAPLESILAPMFFVVIGLQVKLETFYHWNVIILACGLIIAAIIGKLLSGFGACAKDDRLLIGIGMLPRGEVGLVFASIGRTLGVVSDDLFSAVVLMVMVTTFIAPPLLKARYAQK